MTIQSGISAMRALLHQACVTVIAMLQTDDVNGIIYKKRPARSKCRVAVTNAVAWRK